MAGWQAPGLGPLGATGRPLGWSPGNVVHAGKERTNVFSLPIENDSERRALPPGRREPDSAVSEDDLSQMLKS